MSPERIDPITARRRQQAGARLLDVREPHEQAEGMAEGAQAVSLAQLLEFPEQALPDSRQQALLLICRSGARSLVAAQALADAGFAQVTSVDGGTEAWRAQGLPLQIPDDAPDADFLDRYSRQLRLPGIGLQGQRRLQSTRVVMLGAGGLGAPAAFYLAAAGVGHLRLVDDDRVERSNLHRQVVHVDAAVGERKVDSAAQRLQALNPTIHIEPVPERLSAANVERVLDGADVVIDGADNFAVRYLLNDACVKLRLPLVYGAVHRFHGQVGVFDAGRQRGVAPCYRCLFPQPPAPENAPNCAEAGVLGVLPGVIGMLQATEALKLLLGIGQPLIGRLLRYDALAMRFSELRLPPDPDCAVCAASRPFPGYIDYDAFCSAQG